MSLKIIECSPSDQILLRQFVKFEFDLYKGCSNNVPFLKAEYLDTNPNSPGLLVAEHPFHKYATTRYFMVHDDGKIVGRITAFINHRHNNILKEKAGFFGFFECIPKFLVAKFLLDAACTFIRQHGATRIYGPTSFVQNENEHYGLLIEGDRVSLPYFGTSYNKQYYSKYLEQYGFLKAKDLIGYRLSLFDQQSRSIVTDQNITRLSKLVKLTANEGLTIRTLDQQGLKQGLIDANNIYNAAFSGLWGFLPVENEDLMHMVRVNPSFFRTLYDMEMYSIVYHHGKAVGMIGYLKDLNQARVRGCFPGSDLDCIRKIKAKLLNRRINRVRLFVIAVSKKYRGRYVLPLMLQHSYLTALQRNRYRECEISWILEENTESNKIARAMNGELYKRWRVYKKDFL